MAVRRRDEGFTLIELLIVIIVLGILATIVLMGTGTFRSDAQAASCNADATTLHHAVTAYKVKTDTWPTGADGAARVQVLIDAGYIERAPSTGATIVDDTGDVGGC